MPKIISCPVHHIFTFFSPVIVGSDADLIISSRRVVWGKWTNCGQTCLSPDYILLTESLKLQFVNEIVQRLKEFYGPEPQKSEDYSRIINEKHFEFTFQTVLNNGFAQNSERLYFGSQCGKH